MIIGLNKFFKHLVILRIARFQNDYSRYEQAYFYSFLIAILLCWSPSKLLAYLAPWLAIGIFLFVSRSQISWLRLVVIAFLWLVVLLFHFLLTPGFMVHSALLSFFTYGSFVFVLVVPTRRITGEQLSDLLLFISRWVLLFQSCWGIAQGIVAGFGAGTFDGGVGDAVAGTIRPFGYSIDFSNPMFAVNIAVLLILIFPLVTRRRKGFPYFIYVVGVLALVMASVVHVILIFAAAVLISITIFFPFVFIKKHGLTLVSIFLTLGFLIQLLIPNNIRSIQSFSTSTLEGQTPRSQAVQRALYSMPSEYPWMPVFGLGSGQYSSRAGLIGTGMFFGGPFDPIPLPLLPTGMSEPFRIYVYDLWLSLYNEEGEVVGDNSSAVYKPFFSLLSVYVEGGAMAIVLIVGLVMRLIWRIYRHVSVSKKRLESASVSAGIIFFFLLGTQENYWEIPQAIFPGLMLLKCLYADLIYDKRDDFHA